MNKSEDETEYGIGSLINFKDLTEEQQQLFMKLVSDDFNYAFQILFNIIGDKQLVLELLDIFAGQKIQFPSRKKLYKLVEKIKIYTFVKSKNYSEESCHLLAKQYKKRISQIKAVVDRIDYLLNNGKYKDIEDFERILNNKDKNN